MVDRGYSGGAAPDFNGLPSHDVLGCQTAYLYHGWADEVKEKALEAFETLQEKEAQMDEEANDQARPENSEGNGGKGKAKGELKEAGGGTAGPGAG